MKEPSTILNFLTKYSEVFIPIISFVLGFIVSRFTLSKKEKMDHEQRQFENSKEIMELGNKSFQEFSAALQKYINNKKEPTLDDFFSISTSGENYFYQMKITCDAILINKIDPSTRDNTLLPKIKEAVEKTLPLFYSTLQNIADKKNIKYKGTLKRSNYESMYIVVEKYT